jgi:hypothetical protein
MLQKLERFVEIFSVDSPAIANTEKRAVMNILHASETPEEAAHEIKHWFGDDSKNLFLIKDLVLMRKNDYQHPSFFFS